MQDGSESLALDLHGSLKEVPLLVIGYPDSEVLDTDWIEPDPAYPVRLRFQNKQE
jgi:hypothetical protein